MTCVHCPYSLDLLHPTPENAPPPHYEMMDLSDTFDFPDVMATTSNEDIPDLDDVFGPLNMDNSLDKL